jgi:hypothetical protein
MWADDVGDQTGFQRQRYSAQTGWVTLDTDGSGNSLLSADTFEFVDSGVTPGTWYLYRVRATDGSFVSPWLNLNGGNEIEAP